MTSDPTVKLLAEFIQAERNIYAQCPNCEEIHRLNEFKIFYGKKPPKDLLDQLREAAEEFEDKKKKIIEQAIERSKVTYIGKTLEHLAPTVVSWGHQPRDCRFLAEPIDFISFDGLFERDEVDKITFIEAKTGNAKLSSREKSIKDAVEKGEVYFEEFKMASSG
jgi:predicted Holliday junction resolvase-like endonuclease